MSARTIMLTDEQCADICGSIEQLGINMIHAAALTNAAITTHLAGHTGAKALAHTADLYELNLDLMNGTSQTSREMAEKVIGK